MRRILDNKKGAEFTIGTLIIIILAIVVLVVLIVGFIGGWGNLWANIQNLFSSGVGPESAKSSCSMACDLKNAQDFCCAQRSVNFNGQVETGITCRDSRLETACPAITCDLSQCYRDEAWAIKYCKDNCQRGNPKFCNVKNWVKLKSQAQSMQLSCRDLSHENWMVQSCSQAYDAMPSGATSEDWNRHTKADEFCSATA
jgi:nitrate reductase NapE component